MRIEQFNPSDTVSELNRYSRTTPSIVKTYLLVGYFLSMLRKSDAASNSIFICRLVVLFFSVLIRLRNVLTLSVYFAIVVFIGIVSQ